jgi:hypothetical protein
MAFWLLKNGHVPVPLNEFGIVLPDGRRSEGKEPHLEIGQNWGKLIWTLDELVAFYGLHPRAGIGALLDIWMDFDCDGPGAKETLIELLSPDIPDSYGWLASRGEHHGYLKDDRAVALSRRYNKNIFKIGNLEIRINGFGLQLQSALPPTCTNIGTKEDPIPGPPRVRIGAPRFAHLPDCFFVNFARMWEAQEAAKAKVKPSRPVLPGPSSNGHHEPRGPSKKPSDYQVTHYIAEVEPSISGEGGHNKTFDLAKKLIGRFGERRDWIIDWLWRFYNDRCVPPWTLKDLEHKVDDALKTTRYDPREPSPGGKDQRDDRRWESYNAVTFGAVARKIGKMTFLWESWLVIGNINMICSKPKYGKTRFYLALAKCLWEGATWPDGQANTNPPGSKMLVAPYDRNHAEIADAMVQMGIPDEAIYCAHDPEDELLVPDLATPDMMKAIDWYATRDPAIKMVVIDTLTYASSTPLFKPEDMKKLLDPLMQIAAKHRLSVLVLIHENREGLALGNRITERARVLMQLERYSEADPTKLRLYVKDSNFPGRPAITVIHDHSGLKFGLDEGPIKYQNGKPRGPQPVKSERFADWLKNQLEVEPRQVVDLVRLARMDGLMESPTDERVKVSISPLYNARDQVARLYPGFVVEESEVEHGAGGRRKAWTLYGPNRQMSEPPGKAPY